jgi:arginase
MTIISVPYHLDEYLPDLDLPLAPDQVVTVGLPAGDPWERMAVLQSAVAGAVAGDVASGACPVVLSGDCNTSAGIMAGLQRAGADPGIVWFDAHGDVQTLETTTSGYLGGLALRLLTAYRPELIAARLGLRPVPEHRIVLAGARDLDPPEVTYLAGAAIGRRDVAGLTAAGLPDGPLYVHVDLDVIDAAGLPGLRYPVPGGPDAAQLADALRLLLDTGQVAALGIACSWHPGHAAARHVARQLSAVLRLPARPRPVPSRFRLRRCAPGAARWHRAARWPRDRTAPGPVAAPRPGRTPRPPR